MSAARQALAERRRVGVYLNLYELGAVLAVLPQPGRGEKDLKEAIRRLVRAQDKREAAVRKAANK